MSPDLIDALALCRNLPSPPAIALRVIELAQDPETDISLAAEVISMDMALSARMMRIANSPLYASRRRIENLSQALTMLGLNATLQLALGFSLTRALRDGSGDDLAHQRISRRSILSALAARFLGHAKGNRRSEELMLAGLLQDIGMLALLQLRPDAYYLLLARADNNQTLLASERAEFGCTHAEVGARAAEQWNLPPYLTAAIAHSESLEQTKDTLQKCVALSGCIADIWLSDNADQARSDALQQVNLHLQLDSAQFDQVLAQISGLLPGISASFDTPVPTPARVHYLIEHASELIALRNLRELQDASLARQRADELEARADRLSEQAHLDALTGVLNRRQLEAVLEEEFARASRHDWPLSIAFIDLDDFKKINDMHGHLTGDEVLRAFAAKLQELMRNSDTVARFGGEEFIVMFPSTPEDIAVDVIRRVLSTIASTPMAEIDGAPLHVTFSAGVAAHGAYERFANVQDLLKAADDVLYRSKNLGRNRVIARAPATQPAAC